jgi:ABC-2 type transport system ATP-binding protein
VLANARLHRLADAESAARRALETVHMTDAQGRDIATYSKGMRQRVKMASALVHDPAVLLLDEPFNGMDPRQRLQLMDLLHRMGAEGRTVLFSSHILEEVEALAGTIEVLVAGRHAASGDFREIRRLMTERPHQYVVRSSDDRALAAALIADPCASAVELVAAHDTESRLVAGSSGVGRRDGSSALHVQAVDFGAFVRVLPEIASRQSIRLYEVSPSDESLEKVFGYLVAR